MKKLFRKGTLICLLLCLFGISVHAYSGSCGDNVKWTLENGTLTISGSGEMTEYEEIDAVPWREMRESITRVVVEEGVTYLGKWSIYDMDSLVEISLPSTLKSTGSGVIRGCDSLRELVLPEGMESFGYMSVGDCEMLTKITIPSTLTELDDEVFTDLPALTTISVAPQNDTLMVQDDLLINVKTMTVESGAAATGKVEIPKGIQTIKGQAFMCNPSITEIVVPEGVTVIEGMAFYRCESLETVYLPASLQKFGMYVLHRSENLKTVYYAGSSPQWNAIEFPISEDESLPVVESVLQYGVPVPESGVTVGETAVYEETTESTETVYSGETEYVDLASGVCGDSLQWTLTQWADHSTGESGAFLGITGSGAMWDYSPENPAPWADYAGMFDQISAGWENVTSIGDYAFYGCENVDVVFLPETITYFGENCMTGCNVLDVVFYDGTLEQWEQVTVEENNDVLLSALCYYVPEEDTYYPISNETEAETEIVPVQENEVQQETAVSVVSESPVVTEEATEESGLSSTMILVIVALVVLVIAIATSTTVIILVLRRNKQMVQAAQSAAAPPPPVDQQYGFSQNSRYDPYSQYHQDDNQ